MARVVPSEVVKLIDRLFPWADDTGSRPYAPLTLAKGHLGSVATLLALVKQVPEELLIMPGDEYAEFLVGTSALQAAVESWQSGDNYHLAQVSGFGHVVTLVRGALAACPDEFPASGTAELRFIEDAKLREGLRLDISAANRAFANAEWKAATVLAGSVVEALLLWALQTRPRDEVSARAKAGGNPEDWGLAKYVELALGFGLIDKDTAAQVDLARQYRNLIHPGATVRLKKVCDRGTALTALAAVEGVVRDFTNQAP